MGAVETFRGISLLIFKWLLFALLGLVAIGLVVWAGFYAFQYLSHDRYAAKVEVWVDAYNEKGFACSDNAEYPVFVGIRNNSAKAIEKVSFILEARRKGYSTNLATYDRYSDDKIIAPGQLHGACWRAPLRSSTSDHPKDLDWEVTDVHITFE